MNCSDWLPTLLGLATGGQWTGSLSGAEVDGVDIWSAVTSGGKITEPHPEIVHYADGEGAFCLQHGETVLLM
jgi:hypothetical protein